jgi:Fe-S cluster biosynthesis and repair protein YggX
MAFAKRNRVGMEVEVYKPKGKRYWEKLIMGNFDEWIKKYRALAEIKRKNYANKDTR